MTSFERLKPHLLVMQANFRLLWEHFNYRILALPPAAAILLWIIMLNGFFKPTKPPLEIAALVVNGFFMLTAAFRYSYSRHAFFLWTAALFLLILCREIHFVGTDQAIFIGLAILLGILLRKLDRFKDYFLNPRLINLFVTGFFFYFLSQTVDQRWWKIFPGESAVFVPLEESLEMLGHMTLGFALVFCKSIIPVNHSTSSL